MKHENSEAKVVIGKKRERFYVNAIGQVETFIGNFM
jgi:hypothetical protein